LSTTITSISTLDQYTTEFYFCLVCFTLILGVFIYAARLSRRRAKGSI
jgi:hypothetical protein